MVWHLESLSTIGATDFPRLVAVFHTDNGCGPSEGRHLRSHGKHSSQPSLENDKSRISGRNTKNMQVKALHVLVDELDVPMAKPLLTALYMSKPSKDHRFPLHIRMQLVLEMDAILNTKGHQNADKLRACQNTWLSGKLAQIKTWELELLDNESKELGMMLRDAMMDLRHPTNKRFNLFHSIDKHFRDQCHVLMVLKSAESHAHAMIAAMLPYLLWHHVKGKQGPKASALKKWFKPAA